MENKQYQSYEIEVTYPSPLLSSPTQILHGNIFLMTGGGVYTVCKQIQTLWFFLALS